MSPIPIPDNVSRYYGVCILVLWTWAAVATGSLPQQSWQEVVRKDGEERLGDVMVLLQMSVAQNHTSQAGHVLAADLGYGPQKADFSLMAASTFAGTAQVAAIAERAVAQPWVIKQKPRRAEDKRWPVHSSNFRESQAEVEKAKEDPWTQLSPHVWAALGPLTPQEAAVDPLQAFGGFQGIVDRAPKLLWDALAGNADLYATKRRTFRMNHSEVMKLLSQANHSQFDGHSQSKLEDFPTEYGAGGRTIWALAYADSSVREVSVNFTDAAVAAGSQYTAPNGAPTAGWSVGEFTLDHDMVLLARCNEAFSIDDSPVQHTPDAYEEHRSVGVFHLKAGTHRIFVRFFQAPFWCDLLEDSPLTRENVTAVGSQGHGPLGMLWDVQMSDVVEGSIASPFVAVPVFNAANRDVILRRAVLLNSTPSEAIEHLLLDEPENETQVAIVPGQSFILRLLLQQKIGSNITCKDKQLSITLRLDPETLDGQPLESTNATLNAVCWWNRQGGFKVTFPDFDGSVQRMWVAPPNVEDFPNKQCPTHGCPIMLSLHGANVVVGPAWGHSYSTGNESDGWPFPYPAWLVQPSNRFHWGTDWEGPGYDNGLASMGFVIEKQPGVPEQDKEKFLVDPDRMLLTGHSMGGHGCLVFSTHDPDPLVGSACGACWTSQARYASKGGSPLLEPLGTGTLQARMAEHASDFLAANMRGVPLKLVYGDLDDNVPPNEPRYMSRLVNSYSGDANTVSVTELQNTGHWFNQHIPELQSFFSQHLTRDEMGTLPLPELPDSFTFTVASTLSFGTKGNLKLLQLSDAARPGKFFVRRCTTQGASDVHGDCQVSLSLMETNSSVRAHASSEPPPDDVWLIDTFNVQRFRLNDPPLRGRPVPENIILDGQRFTSKAYAGVPEGTHFCMAKSNAVENAEPTWGVCSDNKWKLLQRGSFASGPIHNVLRRSRLCVVYGSGEGHFDEAQYLANKLYFVSRYAVPVVNGSSSTEPPSACRDANLVLLGGPDENAWTEKHKCSFSYVRFHGSGRRGFKLAGVSYKNPQTGLLAMGRLEGKRLAVLVYGVDGIGLHRAGVRVPITSFMDGADYFVLGQDAGWEGEGGMLAAGYLDPLWQPSLESWAEPEHAVKRWEGNSYEDLGHSRDYDRCAAHRQLLLESDAERRRLAPTGSAAAPVLLLGLHLGLLASVLPLM